MCNALNWTVVIIYITRLKIMRNIGNAFVKMGAYQDAITSFEAIMEGSPDYHTGM